MRTLMMVTAVVYAVGSYSFGGATMAQGRSAGAAKNVVLVHGAFADDSSWSKIVPLLKAKGFRVTTASNRDNRGRAMTWTRTWTVSPRWSRNWICATRFTSGTRPA